MATTFRRAIYTLLPAWLRGEDTDGEATAYTLAVLKDWWLQRLRDGLMARYPAYAPDDALGLIGRGRKITRGINEPRSAYEIRLRRWLTDHKRRGGPFAMLEQLGAYWDGDVNGPYQMVLIYRSGVYFERDTSGTISYDTLPSWDVDDEPERWARWLLILHWHEDVAGDDVWGSPGTWGDDGVWGSDMTQELVRQLRLIPNEWNAAHPNGRIGLLGPGAELWGYPVGTWGDPGVWGGGSYTEIDVE